MIKNLKRLSVLFSLLFAFVPSFAQKVDLDPYNFNFESRDLPHTIIDPNLKSYYVVVDAGGNISRAMSPDAIASKIILHGFERRNGDGDVKIYVRFDDLIIESNDVKESVYERKDKEGAVTKEYSYTLNIEYSVGGSAEATDRTGKTLIKNYQLILPKRKSWSSQTFKSSSAAYEYFRNNKSSITNNLANERINEALAELNRKINYEMGFPVEKMNYFLWLVDNKKHPEHEIMKARWETFKPILQGITANNFSDADRAKVLDEIVYFNSLKTKYPGTDKGEVKIRYAAYYNMAQLYLLLDAPEKVAEFADALIANDYDSKDGEKLKKQATELTELFKKNNIYTRHFNADETKPYKN